MRAVPKRFCPPSFQRSKDINLSGADLNDIKNPQPEYIYQIKFQ